MSSSIQYSALGVALFAFTPFALGAELTSESYTLTPRIGESGYTVQSSESYTLTPEQGGSAFSEITLPPVRGSRSGSRTSSSIPNAQPLISGTTEVSIVEQPVLIDTKPGGSVVSQSGEDADVTANGLFDEVNNSRTSPEVREGMEASAMSAYLKNRWDALGERTSRGIIAVFVLLSLLFLRSYTAFGRKYRPF